MRSLQDALYNWLTIKIIAEARPTDEAAQETYALFDGVLKNDHGVEQVAIEKNEEMYLVTYTKEGQTKSTRFPTELIDCFLEQMEREPEKFQNY